MNRCYCSSLISEWKKCVCNGDEEFFIEDGFYPYYTKQPKKILFIARECLGLAGLSFAFMNLSKFSNESKNWKVDVSLINSFLDKSSAAGNNFFTKEIEFLNPDLIITMNLGDWLDYLGEVNIVELGKEVSHYELAAGGKSIPIMETWHFSAPNKSDFENYYELLIAQLKKYRLFKKKLDIHIYYMYV